MKTQRVSPVVSGLLPLMAFWCVVMGLLYLVMSHYLAPRKTEVLANGDLVIPRARDGHFYATGHINGRPARFMVDTGASLVSMDAAFAEKAGIVGGSPTTFKTANGDRPGRVVQGVEVAVGQVVVTNVSVGVGLRMGAESDVLLGQSFLSKFDISIQKDQMLLRAQ